jgi:hypothetical protein
MEFLPAMKLATKTRRHEGLKGREQRAWSVEKREMAYLLSPFYRVPPPGGFENRGRCVQKCKFLGGKTGLFPKSPKSYHRWGSNPGDRFLNLPEGL